MGYRDICADSEGLRTEKCSMSNTSLSKSSEPMTVFTYSSKMDVASSLEALQQVPCVTLAAHQNMLRRLTALSIKQSCTNALPALTNSRVSSTACCCESMMCFQ